MQAESEDKYGSLMTLLHTISPLRKSMLLVNSPVELIEQRQHVPYQNVDKTSQNWLSQKTCV